MKRLAHLMLPLVGVCLALLVWWAASLKISDLPSPWRTWEESKIYILEPFEKRGETDQGIALLAYYSLVRVAQGFPRINSHLVCLGTGGMELGALTAMTFGSKNGLIEAAAACCDRSAARSVKARDISRSSET